jgi:hypothetical protein
MGKKKKSKKNVFAILHKWRISIITKGVVVNQVIPLDFEWIHWF